MRLTVALFAGFALIAAVACGSDDGAADSPSTAPETVPSATPPPPAATPTPEPPTTTGGPTSTPEPSTATLVLAVSDEELSGIAALIFPTVGDAGYGACDNLAEAPCPLTARLRLRLADPTVRLCRCQNVSTTREIEVLPGRLADGGGIVRVTLFDGSLSHDLVVVAGDGEWLVDDEYCAGRPETSIYEHAGTC